MSDSPTELPDDAAVIDDTEGHRAHRFDGAEDGEDDTEGHRAHR